MEKNGADFTDPKLLKECLEWLLPVTIEAGKIVKEGFLARDVAVDTKAGAYDFVTEYDGRTEEFLKAAIEQKYPGHRFIGEEETGLATDLAELTDEPTWIIDPIDGTANFVHKIPMIALGIALCYRKKVVLGVCYNPILDEMFSATLGGGAFLNGQPIHVSSKRLMQDCIVADETSLAFLPKITSRLIGRTFRIVTQVAGMRALGSAVLTLAYVAAGRIDAYQIEFLKPWDIAGGTLLVTEAGGIVRDSYTGGQFDIMKPNVLVAATQEIYDAMWHISQETAGKTVVLQ